MRISLLLILATVILVGCAVTTSAEVTGHEPTVRQSATEARRAHLPTEPAGFILADVLHFPDPRLGVRIRYRHEESSRLADVFVYPIGIPSEELTEEMRSDRVRRMFEQGKNDIRAYEERGRYQDLTFSPDVAVRFESPHGPTAGWATTAQFGAGEMVLDSHLFLVSIDNFYVKFRSTHPRGEDELHEAVTDFIEAFLREFQMPGSLESLAA